MRKNLDPSKIPFVIFIKSRWIARGGLVLFSLLFVLYLLLSSLNPLVLEQNIKYCHVPIRSNKSFYFDHVHIFWNEQIFFHQSAEWELSYVIKGSGSRVVGDVVETFCSGEVILVPPHLPHGWSFNDFDHDESGKIENITINFPASLLANLAHSFPETEAYTAKLNGLKQALSFEGDTLRLLQTTMIAMCSQNDMEQLSSLLNIFSRIVEFGETRAVGYCQKQNKSTLRLQDVSRFLIHNYHRKITLQDMAKHVGMSRASFCTFFR